MSYFLVYFIAFQLLQLTCYSFSPSHPLSLHIEPSHLAMNISYLNSVDTVELRKISFLGSQMFVAKKSKDYDDSVDFVLQGWSGEPQVAVAFQNKLAHEKGNACFTSNHRSRPIVLDIGANGGIYGMYSAMMGCSVYFFDVQPACVNGIYLSTVMNGISHRAHVIHRPVGNVSKDIELDVSTNCFGAYRTSTGNQHKEYNTKQEVKGKTTMQMIRLDDIFAKSLQDGRWVVTHNCCCCVC